MNNPTKRVMSDKKKKILLSAISVFSEKGFRESTISDLAKKVKIGEATVYNHFRNKDEILLSIPLLFIHEFSVSMDEQLGGIRKPEEKLQRYIWHYLWWCQKHKDFVRVFVLEINPHPNYCHSEAYGLNKEFTKLPETILEEGKKTGHFREGIDPRIFRKFLIGAIDYLFLTTIVFGRPFHPLDDYDDLMEAVFSAIVQDDKVPSGGMEEVEEKRERVLLAAEEILSKKSFSQTSIAEIAKRARVADGTIYEYFENKEALLFSIFEKRMQEFTEVFDETISPEKPGTKLKHILWHFLNWVQSRREWALVYYREIVHNPRFYTSDKHHALREYDNKLIVIFEEGRKKGVFRNDLKIHLFRALVTGPIHALGYSWAAFQRKYDLINDLDGLYDLVHRAVKFRPGQIRTLE